MACLADSKPTVVHECARCHTTVTPAESGQSVNVSGVIQCRVCAYVGPLRIKVVMEDRR
jgi:hypothetical protein